MAMTSDEELIARVRRRWEKEPCEDFGGFGTGNDTCFYIDGTGLWCLRCSTINTLDTLARRLEEHEAVIADFVHLCVSALTDGLFDDDQAQLGEMHRAVDAARALLQPHTQEGEEH